MKYFTGLKGILILLGILGLTQAAGGAPPAPPPSVAPPHTMPAPPPPALQHLAPGVFEIGKCKIIKAEGKVEFPAAVNMKEGMLEYLLVGNTGKLHESLLRTDVEPYNLQVALLLTGLEGSLTPLSAQGENRLTAGDAVDIVVRWQESGRDKRARIEELILVGKQPVGQMPWVFTGSVVRNGIFAAQADKSIIAVFHDPVAMFDHRLESGNNDKVWSVNSQATPAIGTPMTVSITRKQAKDVK